MNTDTSYQKDVDPVCGMQVDPHKTDLTAEYDGQTYFFCAENCRKAFENQPRKYLAISKDTKRKGFWQRYLDRLNRATGGKPPSCCH
jgi:YHS domain-containing protein